MKKETKSLAVELVYEAPLVEIFPIQVEDIICESPLPGGNEGIGFENWN